MQKFLHILKTAAYSARPMSSLAGYNFETLLVKSPATNVYHVSINRPEKRNAMNRVFWKEIKECFDKVAEDSDCRAVVLSGEGKAFSAGIDLMDLAQELMKTSNEEVGRRGFKMATFIRSFQESFTSLEKCLKPVIAAIHGACVGGGVDLVCAADVRYALKDAWFQIKEVEVGLAADVGTLQRLPKITGNESLVRELAFTGRKFTGEEALQAGLVSRLFEDEESLLEGALSLAQTIASMSPVAVQGTKQSLVFSRDHSVQEALDQMVTWNMCMLQSEDLIKAATASMQKEKAEFAKL